MISCDPHAFSTEAEGYTWFASTVHLRPGLEMPDQLLFESIYALGLGGWMWDRDEPDPVLVRWAARPARVLDVGCGTGTHAVYLARQGAEVDAIDFAPRAVQRARARARRSGVAVRVLEADVLAFESSTRYDLIVDYGCFHSLPIASRARYVAAIARHAAPGTTFVLMALSPRWPVDWRLFGPHHVSAHTIESLFGPHFELLETAETPTYWQRPPSAARLITGPYRPTVYRFRRRPAAAIISSFRRLEEVAAARVEEARDHPWRRRQLRVDFYRRHPSGAGLGHGRSELDFIRWQLVRGTLRPLAAGGSPYWRTNQERIARDAELASLAAETSLDQDQRRELPPGASAWLDWIESPSIERWYAAHNISLVQATAENRAAAHREPAGERAFINEALVRVLLAEVLLAGGMRTPFGPLGVLLADPRGPTVRCLTAAPQLYPRDYPSPLAGASPGALRQLLRLVERELIRGGLDRATLARVTLPRLRALVGSELSPEELFERLFSGELLDPSQPSSAHAPFIHEQGALQ